MIPGVARVLLLLPSGTYKAPDFLAAAAASTSRSSWPRRPSRRWPTPWATGPWSSTSPTRPASAGSITALAARRPLDAVVAVDDQGLLIAALAAKELGLPANAPRSRGPNPQQGRHAHRPGRAPAASAPAEVVAGRPRQPAFRVVGRGDDVVAAAEPRSAGRSW